VGVEEGSALLLGAALTVGAPDGVLLGSREGKSDGIPEGLLLGCRVGVDEGEPESEFDGD